MITEVRLWGRTVGAAMMKRVCPGAIIEEVQGAVKRWPEFAAEAGLADEWRDTIQKTHRLSFPEI
jgi:hypothetical protein